MLLVRLTRRVPTIAVALTASTFPASVTRSSLRSSIPAFGSYNSKTKTLHLIPRRAFSSPNTTTAPIPPPPGQSKWRTFLQILGRTTLITILTGAAIFYYVAQKQRYPGPQLPFDPEKKTVVILGSGWGATSLLKNLDTEDYNVVVISPRNYFLFTPLLPSVAVGTISPRSILEPIRYITRHKKRQVTVIEAESHEVDPVNKTVTFIDNSEIKGEMDKTTIPYDYLVFAVGAETQTFGIKGVKEHACFLKELQDAEKLQRRFLDCVESAAFPGQSDEEIDRLLHIMVVGGGPTGVEVSGEMHDFLEDDLKSWYPELASRIRITLIEALPSVLPTFSKELVTYTVSTFKASKIDILTKTMVQEIKENSVVLKMPDGTVTEMPCGLVIWAAGNTTKKITRDLIPKFPEEQTNKRGLLVDDHLAVKGSDGTILAIGDCTFTQYAPTAQVASQQGAYLSRIFKQMAKRDVLEKKLRDKDFAPEETEEQIQKQLERIKLKPFQYSHQGSLAYIGSDKAIADLPVFNGNFSSGGVATYLFWRSAYLSTLFSLRNRTLVATDWLKCKLFGRDVSRE